MTSPEEHLEPDPWAKPFGEPILPEGEENPAGDLDWQAFVSGEEAEVVEIPPPGEGGGSEAAPAPDDTDEAVPDDEAAPADEAEADEAGADEAGEDEKDGKKRHSLLRELPILILIALVVAVLIKTFFVQAFYIPSGSMIPTLEVNDRVLVNKLSPRFGVPNRGDVIVFDSPSGNADRGSFPGNIFRSVGESIGVVSRDADLIKRVIGLPGEVVEIRDNMVFVDGGALDEPYLAEGTRMADMPAVTVPPGELFVMGDNRSFSSDSRAFGTISEEEVVGRAFSKVWPPSRWGGL